MPVCPRAPLMMPVPPPRCGSRLRVRREIPPRTGASPTNRASLTALREIRPPLAASPAHSLSSTSLPKELAAARLRREKEDAEDAARRLRQELDSERAFPEMAAKSGH